MCRRFWRSALLQRSACPSSPTRSPGIESPALGSGADEGHSPSRKPLASPQVTGESGDGEDAGSPDAGRGRPEAYDARSMTDLSREELAARAGVTPDYVDRPVDLGIIKPNADGVTFSIGALRAARMVQTFERGRAPAGRDRRRRHQWSGLVR